MWLVDQIFGKTRTEDPILLSLIKSRPLQRLKHISQYGIPDKYYHLKNYSRYEHSIGVMILLKKLGASLEEQIAGLLHDVSHLAFSHVADWALADGIKGKEVYQDKIHAGFISQTEIPVILEKYGCPVDTILNYHRFPLLEKELPDICADRVDYALREMYYWQSPESVNLIIKDLVIFNNQIVFQNQKTAQVFAQNYLELQIKHWGGYEAMMRYFLFSQIIKAALRDKIISKADLFGVEQPIILKLEKSDHPLIRKNLDLLSRRPLPKITPRLGQTIRKKFRYVDPLIKIGKQARHLSGLNPDFARVIKKYQIKNEIGLPV